MPTASLPDAPPIHQDQAAKLDLTKLTNKVAAYTGSLDANVQDRVLAIRDVKKAAEQLLDAIKTEQAVVDAEMLEWFADNAVDGVRQAETGRGVHTINQMWASVKADTRDAGFAALRAAGAGSLVAEQVNSQSLSAWVRERITAATDAAEDQAARDRITADPSLALPDFLRPLLTLSPKTIVGTSSKRS